jgi:hypothetical protein
MPIAGFRVHPLLNGLPFYPEGLTPCSPDPTPGPYFQLPLGRLPSALDLIPAVEGRDCLDMALNSVSFFPRIRVFQKINHSFSVVKAIVGWALPTVTYGGHCPPYNCLLGKDLGYFIFWSSLKPRWRSLFLRAKL